MVRSDDDGQHVQDEVVDVLEDLADELPFLPASASSVDCRVAGKEEHQSEFPHRTFESCRAPLHQERCQEYSAMSLARVVAIPACVVPLSAASSYLVEPLPSTPRTAGRFQAEPKHCASQGI